jgi:hypothetical protein
MGAMATWTSRLNTVFSFFGIVMTAAIAVAVASTYFHSANVKPVLRYKDTLRL